MIIACDMDGVLAIGTKRDKVYSKQNKYERLEFERLRAEMYKNSPLLFNPNKSFYIISGRKEKYRDISDEWIKKNNLNVIKSFYLTGQRNRENITKFKIDTLKQIKADIYYEDDPRLIREIRKQLPNIEVIYIPRTENNIKVIHIKQDNYKKLFI